jgi:hypothetical protein
MHVGRASVSRSAWYCGPVLGFIALGFFVVGVIFAVLPKSHVTGTVSVICFGFAFACGVVLSVVRGWCRGNWISNVVVQNNVTHNHPDMSREPLVKQELFASGTI